MIFAVTFAVNTNHMIEAYAELVGGPPLLVGQSSDDERPDGCRQSSGLELAGIQNALFEANQRLTPDRQHGGRYRRPPDGDLL